jgi:ribosomal protein S18 acetylase RimI-like enzyme
MLIRSFEQHDLAQLTELTIETFGPFYEDSFRPLVGEVIFAVQHGTWREDYRTYVAGLHDPDRHQHVAVAVAETSSGTGTGTGTDATIAGYVGWSIDPSRKHGRVKILAVADEHRRGHLGTELCEHAFDHMRSQGIVVVEIGTGGDDDFHAPARALYESLGCIKITVAAYLRAL